MTASKRRHAVRSGGACAHATRKRGRYTHWTGAVRSRGNAAGSEGCTHRARSDGAAGGVALTPAPVASTGEGGGRGWRPTVHV
eukprot:7387319-Prymnesium_polylepis.2